jgi:uncharacterized protein (TIGR02145 family)
MKIQHILFCYISTFLCLSLVGLLSAQGVAIGGSVPDSSAVLDLQSQTLGFLPPRMTSAQRDAIVNPAAGLQIYNTSTHCINYYTGQTWAELCGWICGNNFVTFNYKGQQVTYGTVVGQNGRCWMDRNLGAAQVAQSPTDAQSYGDLFQWGRADDGHQNRNSGVLSTLSSSDNPGHSSFITGTGSFGNPPFSDWRSPQNANLWQGLNGINNPCPSGWRLPTAAEWDAERVSWNQQNLNGAYNSPLKLPSSGRRNSSNASLFHVGTYGYYWASDTLGSNSRILYFFDSDALLIDNFRGAGHAVRCTKE